MWVEQTATRILEVTSARIDLPCLGLAHAPQLNQPIVGARHNQGHSGMEGNPVNAPVVALQNKLDDGIGITKHIRYFMVSMALARTV